MCSDILIVKEALQHIFVFLSESVCIFVVPLQEMSAPMLSTTVEAATGKVVAVSPQLYQPPSHPDFDFLT